MANGDKSYFSDGASGEIDGTGAAITIQTGFKPVEIRLYNIDDAGGATDAVWIKGMPAASLRKWVDSGAGVTNGAWVTSNGVTVGNSGFIIGTDGDVNVSGETIHWIAYRGD